MFSEKITQSSIEEIRAVQPHAVDRFMICDVGGLVVSARKHKCDHIDVIEHGVPELTALADQYVRRFENDVFLGRGWDIVDAVVGAVPNIPALLAGHPHGMRMRRRTTSIRGPLTVLFELTGSGGTISVRAERGAAMLALVRLLANTRPVDLWTLTTYGNTGDMNMVACQLDTAPLDTARSAAMLCDNRALSLISDVNHKELRPERQYRSWSYGTPDLERRWSGEAFRRMNSLSSELLFIPAAWMEDNFHNPEQWVRDMLKKYGMSAVQRDNEEEQ